MAFVGLEVCHSVSAVIVRKIVEHSLYNSRRISFPMMADRDRFAP